MSMLLVLGLFGLWVDPGHYSTRHGAWVREPTAEFMCRAGCARSAVGAADVAQFCRAITAWHLAACPALRKRTTDDHS